MFDLVTGEPRSFPATTPVPVFVVEVEGDDVVLVLP
jgi:nitrite reductase/ring-hydroxylating ferredoxin subunit